MSSAPSVQYSFRLPADMIADLERCVKALRKRGLDVSRSDVVRLLVRYALDRSKGKPEALMRSKA
jgi:Arc/MetJ-type ribon-helix-helix transcriptional regulator